MKTKLLPEFVGSKMGLYDWSPSGSIPLLADKAIDVTYLCPDSKQCIIKYVNSVNGRLAQIIDCYEKGEDVGVFVHYSINGVKPENLAKDCVFEKRASIMGANALELAKTIIKHGKK